MTDTPQLPPGPRHRGEQGFTLVELLIVIVVLGILSGIVVFGVGQFRADAEAAACRADVTTVTIAADTYDAATGTYPTSMDQLVSAKYLKAPPAGGTYAFDPTARTTVRQPGCPGGAPPPLSGPRITGIGGMCLDLGDDSAENGTPVQLGVCDSRTAQRWTAPASWPGPIMVLGKCLDVQGGFTENLTPIHLYECNGTGAQEWYLEADATLRNPQSGRCLDAAGPDAPAGMQLYIWDCHGGTHQRWNIITL